jgi:hypothetical protein
MLKMLLPMEEWAAARHHVEMHAARAEQLGGAPLANRKEKGTGRKQCGPPASCGLLLAIVAVCAVSVGSTYSAFLMLKWEPIEPRDDVLLSEPGARAYEADQDRILISWKGNWYVVSRRAPLVVRPSNYYGRFFGRDWWHRQSYSGVIVGDRVKDEDNACQRFDGKNVLIKNATGILKITFPDELDARLVAGVEGPWTCRENERF